MQRLLLVLSLLFFIATACKKAKPEGIVSEKEFEDLMTEVHILDGYISSMPIDSSRKVIDPLYVELLAKYKLDTLSFKKNMQFYMGNPNLSTAVYGNIVKRLEIEERDFYKLDSVNNMRFQDSVATAVRIQRKVDLTQQMIQNAKADSVEMSPAEFTRRTFELTGIPYIWDKNSFQGKPISPVLEQAPLPEVKLPQNQEREQQVLSDSNALNSPVAPLDPRFKPVKPRSQKINNQIIQ